MIIAGGSADAMQSFCPVAVTFCPARANQTVRALFPAPDDQALFVGLTPAQFGEPVQHACCLMGVCLGCGRRNVPPSAFGHTFFWVLAPLWLAIDLGLFNTDCAVC